ncbi:hypothetical protein CKY28_06425 [Sphingomonas lenta]|uniref:RCK N-terminal domain-containing protein n=1 Tax=Sphingomonas lenta TaxID=1141887 RepID=A0A2A2SIA6_9SPHN|nr:hypothetical protein CKY28_06425 [Sphingomonas lenta]
MGLLSPAPIGPVAKLLGLTSPGGRGVLIVGSTPWGLLLARQLKTLDVPVVVADTSWQRLSGARDGEVPCFHGEILAEATEERLDFAQFKMLAAVTDNEAYNALVCNEFAPEMGRDAVYQLGDAAGDDPRALPAALRGRALFASGHGVEEVHARVASGWTLGSMRFEHAQDLATLQGRVPDSGDPLLLLRANRSVRFFTHASKPTPEAGDTVVAFAPAAALERASWTIAPGSLAEEAAAPAFSHDRTDPWPSPATS